jgi:hypothetical protein
MAKWRFGKHYAAAALDALDELVFALMTIRAGDR